MTLFLDFLHRIHSISPALAQAIAAVAVRENLPTQHLLLRPSQVVQRVYFLKTGLVRGYTLLHGREVSSWFMQAGDFVISIISFLTQQPSKEHLELLEQTVALSITCDQLQEPYCDFSNLTTPAGS